MYLLVFSPEDMCFSLSKRLLSQRTRKGPLVYSVMKGSSQSPSLRITFIIPSARAASVPGLIGIHSSALAAVGVKRGSIYTVLAPLSLASLKRRDLYPEVSTMFP